MALATCEGRGTPAPETPASNAPAQAHSTCRQATQHASPWREMTLAEYYATVSERAARRGEQVIWVTPPDVREASKAEPTVSTTACAH